MAENGGKTSAQIFKELKGKQKVQFIYDYYKIPILLALAALLLFLTTLHSVLTRKEEILTVALVNVRTPENAERFLGEAYLQKNGYSAKRRTVTLMDQLLVPSGAAGAVSANHAGPGESSSAQVPSPEETNPEYAYAAQMKLVATLSAKELDVVLMDEEALAYFEQNKALLPLDHRHKYLDLTDKALYKKAGFTGKVYAGIVVNSTHLPEAERYLKYLEEK